MDNLDAILTRLAEAPVPASLDMIQARVLARIAAQPAATSGTGMAAITIAAALVMGILGARVPGRATGTALPLSPLAPVSPLAPSTLLAGEP